MPSGGLLGPLAAWFGRWAFLTAPIGVPVGMVAAAVPPSHPDLPAPEWDAKRRRAEQRAKVRARKRVTRRADREGADLRSNALAISLGGMVVSWRIGDLVVPPEGQLGLAWLMVGQPGVGKSTAAHRLGYLCGLERRHLVVVDAKGGHDGLAHGMVAAYLAAFPDARVRLFPQERLDIWRGSPQEVCNRLVETWDWTAESSYWRESAMTALRLALGQSGPPCRSGAELVRRLDPAALERAWLLASASAILLFRTPQPAELAALAGSERVAEGAWSFSDPQHVADFDRVTVTERHRARVDQDAVRQLPTGEATLVVRGLAERIRIIRTKVPGSVETVARGLTRPRPAGALPGNPAPGQGPAGAVAPGIGSAASPSSPAPAKPQAGCSGA